MANYEIRYSCGHTGEKQLYGKETERQRYIAWAERDGICDACRARDKAAAVDNLEAEYEMPPLAGTPKQIAWARKIRAKKFGEVLKFLGDLKPPPEKVELLEERRQIVIQRLLSRKTSRYWIDNEDKTGRALAEAAYKEARPDA